MPHKLWVRNWSARRSSAQGPARLAHGRSFLRMSERLSAAHTGGHPQVRTCDGTRRGSVARAITPLSTVGSAVNDL